MDSIDWRVRNQTHAKMGRGGANGATAKGRVPDKEGHRSDMFAANKIRRAVFAAASITGVAILRPFPDTAVQIRDTDAADLP